MRERERERERERKLRGFTLLELSIVLIIVATLTGLGIAAGNNMLEATRITATENKIAQIKRAIWAFRLSNNRIPCPASLTLPTTSVNFGVEGPQPVVTSTYPGGLNVTQTITTPGCIASAAAPAGTATASFGIRSNESRPLLYNVASGAIPTKTLGLPDDFAFDGWGNRFRYNVSPPYTMKDAFSVNGASCPGTLSMYSNQSFATITNEAVYNIISHGANGHCAYSRSGTLINAGSTNGSERNNAQCNASAQPIWTGTPLVGGEWNWPWGGISYAIGPYWQSSTVSTSVFDDIVDYEVRWKMASDADYALRKSICPNVYIIGIYPHRFLGFKQLWTSYATGFLNNANSITKDSQKNIWFAGTTGSNRVLWRMNNVGTLLSTITFTNGSGNGQVSFGANAVPSAAIDSAGDVWITDFGNNRVQKLTSAGVYISQFAVNTPADIAIDNNGDIWVLRRNNHDIQRFNTAGVLQQTVGSAGSADGQFNFSIPNNSTNGPGFAIDADNNIWVADYGNMRVQKFDKNGNFLVKAGMNGAGSTMTGYIGYPVDVSTDSLGNVYVLDGGIPFVTSGAFYSVLDKNGKWIRTMAGDTNLGWNLRALVVVE